MFAAEYQQVHTKQHLSYIAHILHYKYHLSR